MSISLYDMAQREALGARKKADDIMSRLIEDPEVQALMKRKLKQAVSSKVA